MTPKGGHRFSERIMLRRRPKWPRHRSCGGPVGRAEILMHETFTMYHPIVTEEMGSAGQGPWRMRRHGSRAFSGTCTHSAARHIAITQAAKSSDRRSDSGLSFLKATTAEVRIGVRPC